MTERRPLQGTTLESDPNKFLVDNVMKNKLLQTLAALSLGGLLSLALADEDVRMVRGKPSREQIIEALSSKDKSPEPPPVLTRGLVPMSASQPKATPESRPHPSKRALDLEIMFEFDSARLTREGREVLDVLGDALRSDELANASSIVLEGHTDAKGSDAYNNALSMMRAQAARQYLIQKFSFNVDKIRSLGKGKSQLADPRDPEGAVNRRVRVVVEG
jgi:outer membrane protein OmpA-like peptidoglycan-associated protein